MAAIVSQLPDTKYSYQRIYGGVQEKRVHWFNMEVADAEVVVDEEEIHWGAFMPPFEAAGRLTFELDRNLLQQSLAMMQERSN